MSRLKKDTHWVTPLDMNKYYVYAYFDEFGEPFYIGKGKGYRVNGHLKPSNLNFNSHKNNKIKRLLKTQGFVKRDILAYFSSEKEAYDFEESLISYYGLSNLTNVVSSRNDFPVEAVKERVRLDTPDSIFLEIADRFLLGTSLKVLAEEYKLSPKYLENVLKGRKKSYLNLKQICSHKFKVKVRHLLDVDKISVVDLFNKGFSTKEIAKKLCLKHKAVSSYLTYSGVKPVSRKMLTHEEICNISELRLSGKSYSEIVKITGKSKTTVARICKTVEDVGTVGNGTAKSVAKADTNANNLNKN